MAIMKKQKVADVGEGMEHLGPLYTVWLENGAAAMENSVAVPRKVKK